MDLSIITGLLQESLFMILVFSGFLALALLKGRYALINVILALYFGLLLYIKFPYFDFFLSADSATGNAVVRIVIFLVFTIIGIMIFRRHIPGDDFEYAFQHFKRKIILALMATVLIMAYSYHVLPITELVTPGSPIHALFGQESYFFWWLALPLFVLFFV